LGFSIDLSTVENIIKKGEIEEITSFFIRGVKVWEKIWVENFVEVNYPKKQTFWVPDASYYTTEYLSNAFYYYWYTASTGGGPNGESWRYYDGTWTSSRPTKSSDQAFRWTQISKNDHFNDNGWEGEVYNTYQKYHSVPGYYDTKTVDNWVREDHSYWQYNV